MSASFPFIGEIYMFAGNFAPVGWAFCHGQLVPISEYEALFTLIGTTYGGDGQSTFALPDLRGRAPVHFGQGPGLSNRTQGEAAGTEVATITLSQFPGHTHALTLNASTGPANTASHGGAVLAAGDSGLYATGVSPGTALAANALAVGASTGGGQPHENMQPHLAINFIIALYGIYPSPN